MKSPVNKPTLADLRVFIAVAELRSFRRAAELSGMTRSALSHAIKGLETRLGVRLLHRTTRSVGLTHAGEQLLRAITPHLLGLEQALEEAANAQGQVSGTLRINGSEEAIRLLMRNVVPAYSARYPAVELDLVEDGQLTDIVEQDFDAGIRLGEALPADMVAIRIGPDLRFLAVASPAYLAVNPAPHTPQELAAHRCIRQRLPGGKRYRWEFASEGKTVAVDVPGALTMNHSRLMVEAAEAGLGIAYVPELSAQDALSAGRLVTVLEAWCPSIPGLFLYFPANRHIPASLRAFIDIIREYNASDLFTAGETNE